jgi:glycosyltransferase involved in cell wall biosynthesis
MVEAYGWDGGDAWPRRAIGAFGYALLARQASPLVVHGRALAAEIEAETGVTPAVVPLVPHNLPAEAQVDAASRTHALAALRLEQETLHVATFGLTDRRTKGIELVVGALAELRGRGIGARLHVVGEAPPGELQVVRDTAAELEVGDDVIIHGRVSPERLTLFLRAVDVGVQIRRSPRLTLSGSVADCFAFGVPTVTTDELAVELEAPSYVAAVPPTADSLVLAEAIERLLRSRRDGPSRIESERQGYVARHSVARYVSGLLQALDVDS